VTKAERERRQREKTRRQKANRRKNVIKDAEDRLAGRLLGRPMRWWYNVEDLNAKVRVTKAPP
jgi:hypothetical protein